jgi:hypothetical protein
MKESTLGQLECTYSPMQGKEKEAKLNVIT